MAVTLQVESEEFGKILNRANKANPSKKDVQALKKAFKEHPEIWRQVGNLTRLTQELIIDNTKGTAATRESIQYAVKAIRRDLGYKDASTLEQLLIEQIGLAWLNYHMTQWGHESALDGGTTFKNAAYWERRLNGAHRRYLRAIETLARVRKMGPAVQINIAEKQINHIS